MEKRRIIEAEREFNALLLIEHKIELRKEIETTELKIKTEIEMEKRRIIEEREKEQKEIEQNRLFQNRETMKKKLHENLAALEAVFTGIPWSSIEDRYC